MSHGLVLLLLGCVQGSCETGTGPSAACGPCEGEILVPVSGNQEPSEPAEPHAPVLGKAPEPRLVHLGVLEDPARDRSFLWETDAGTLASRLELWPEGGEHLLLDGASFSIDSDEHRLHEVHACDLQPGTTYHYRVGGAGAWSQEYSFTTAPSGPDASLRFGVLGDSRGSPEVWGSLLHGLAAFQPDFVLFTGDMVTMGTDVSAWEAWFEAAGDVLASVPVLAVHGNHEMLAQPYFAYFALPGNEQWYALDWGPVSLAVLNDTVSSTDALEEQAEWLEGVFSATDRPWKLAAHHEPTWTASTHGCRTDLDQLWGPLWEAWRPNLVFSGHNHLYERSVPILRGKEHEPGTTYVVSGGAGAPLYDAEPEWFTAVSEASYHFIVVEVTPGRLRMVAYRLDGSELDRLELERPGGG